MSRNKRDQERENTQKEAAEKAELNQRIIRIWRSSGTLLGIALAIVFVLLVLALNRQTVAAMQTRMALSHQLAALALVEMQNPSGNDEYASLLALRSLQYGYDPAADE